MALLSGMMRSAAIWGDTRTIDRWVLGRQGGDWADRTVRAAMPNTAARATPRQEDPAKRLRALTELHERGVITDAEYERLRA